MSYFMFHTECCDAKSRYAECHILFFKLNDVLLDLVMLSVIFLNTESCDAGCHYAERHILVLY
jgi:hypothetical protein